MKNNSKKFFTATASTALVASAIVPMASAASFSDTVGNTHETAIKSLSGQGIITGYEDGTFKPNKTLTRSDVVKLLGKYLVAQGYSIPTDYKTNMRFTDLNPNSQDELLKYAAIVKDNKVFNGNNGKLLPQEDITRENMAVVLVRAYSELKDYDFISFVEGETYSKDVQDLMRAKAEARSAIEVLDYYGVTGVPQFNPKSSTTRGQFSSFLYKMMQVEAPKEEVALTLQKVTATDAKTLKVTLSDESVHDVTLPTPLQENIETDVTFKIDDKAYSAKVTYEVAELKVASVESLNGSQLAIKFNQAVDLPATLNADTLKNYVKVSGVDVSGAVSLTSATLSENGRTLTVNVGAMPALSGRYVVNVKGVKNKANTTVTTFDQVVDLGSDTTAPTIESATNIDAKTVRVKFSEPMQAYANGAIQLKLADGSLITGVTGALTAFSQDLELDLSNAKVNGQPLAPNVQVNATFTAARDIAGNLISPNPATVSFTTGGADGVKPTVQAISQTGPKAFKITFSERIVQPVNADLSVMFGSTPNAVLSIAPVSGDNKSYIVTVTNDLAGLTNISTASGAVIKDISGETNTFATTYTFAQNTTAPTVSSYEVVKADNNEYLELTFNNEVVLGEGSTVTANGSYVKNGYNTPVSGKATALAYKDSANKKVVRVKLTDLLNGVDTSDATYNVTLTFANTKSSFGVNADEKAISFTRQSDSTNNTNVLEKPTVITSSTKDSNLTNNQIKLVFNHDVDGTTGNNVNNYTIQGATVTGVSIDSAKKNEVTLTFDSNSSTGERDMTISGVKAANSTATPPTLTFPVNVKENVKPTVTAAAFVSANQARVTFSEAVSGVSNASFIVEIGGTTAAVTSATLEPNNQSVLVTFDKNLAAGNTVTVKAGADAGKIVDTAGNVLNFKETSFVVPQ